MYAKTFEKPQFIHDKKTVQALATLAGVAVIAHFWTLLFFHSLAKWEMRLDDIFIFHLVTLLSMTIYYLPYFFVKTALCIEQKYAARKLAKSSIKEVKQ